MQNNNQMKVSFLKKFNEKLDDYEKNNNITVENKAQLMDTLTRKVSRNNDVTVIQSSAQMSKLFNEELNNEYNNALLNIMNQCISEIREENGIPKQENSF